MERKVRPIVVQNRVFARTNGNKVYDIKDFMDVEVTEVTLSGDRVLMPDKIFAFANTDDRLFIITVAKTEGKYYYGYNLHIENQCSGCGPSYSYAHGNGYDTLVKCLTAALHECESLQFHYNTPPDSRLVKAAHAALDTINRARLVQMSIFDML